MSYRLLCGDTFDIMKKMQEQEQIKVDMIYTSPNPPFFELENPDPIEGEIGREKTFHEYMDNLLKYLKQASFLLKDTGHFWIHAGDYSRYKGGLLFAPERLAITLMDHFKWICLAKVIWWRPDAKKIMYGKGKRFEKDWEILYNFVIRENYDFYIDDNNFWKTSVYRLPYYETPSWGSGYPEDLVRLAVKTCTRKGMTVLDPFMGTGTTGIVACKMGRNFIGIDIDKRSYELTMKRFSGDGG